MNIVAKSLIGLGTLSGLGGAGYAIHQQLSTNDIDKQLISDKYQILDDSNKEWDAILTSYQNDLSKLKFDNFDGKNAKKEDLIDQCKKTLRKPSTDKDNYEKAKKWCTVPRTIKEILGKQGVKLLSIDINNENLDKEAWIKKLENHVKPDEEFKNKKFKGDSKIPESGNVQKDKSNIDAIKTQCSKLHEKKHYEVDFKDNLEKGKLWCTT